MCWLKLPVMLLIFSAVRLPFIPADRRDLLLNQGRKIDQLDIWLSQTLANAGVE